MVRLLSLEKSEGSSKSLIVSGPLPTVQPNIVSHPDPLPVGRDFLGLVYLTLTEAEIQFKPIEPRNARVDLLGAELGRQVSVMLAQSVSVRSVIVCYYDCLVLDSHVPFEPPEIGRGHVLGVPARRGRGQPLAELIARRLSDQGHRHLAIADVEVAGPRPVPAQGLMGIEELLHVPPLGEFAGQLLDLIAVAGRQERIE